ncbi:MAG: hypothetical protein HC892_14420 [Saprospiraceae bacterium]|nr:hypothetical protein [Saprospiraceae bacterium]
MVLFGEQFPSQNIYAVGKPDKPSLAGETQVANIPPELRVKPDDILYIFVYSLDPNSAAPYNIVPGETQRNSVDAVTQGYLVGQDGFIDYPILGRIEVLGLTRQEVTTKLENLLRDGNVKDAVVKVRFINFRISALGEIRRPGVYTFDEENITILELLSFAGDFTELSNREKVFIIRENQGKREYAELNLLKNDFFDSPYFYLQQGDVVYVEPLTAKTAAVASAPLRYINIVGTVVGTVVGTILIFERLRQ